MKTVLKRLREISQSDATVLIYGKTGTGKELTAEGIHENSPRNAGPYIVVDCAAIPEDLIESELFGHVKGAFTGAQSDRAGAFEAAHKGTIFIDEIGELPLELQARILRVLEKQQLKRVGSNKQRQVDVRIIAATNRTLEREVERGRFRQDLFFRLNVLKVDIPSLKDRPTDLEPLIRMFLNDTPTISGEPLELREPDLKRLLDYHWPGNVRELRNAVERAVAFCEHDEIGVEDLPRNLCRATARPIEAQSFAHLDPGLPLKPAKEQVIALFERDYLLQSLERHGMNISKVAREAGINRRHVYRLMKKYGIDLPTR